MSSVTISTTEWGDRPAVALAVGRQHPDDRRSAGPPSAEVEVGDADRVDVVDLAVVDVVLGQLGVVQGEELTEHRVVGSTRRRALAQPVERLGHVGGGGVRPCPASRHGPRRPGRSIVPGERARRNADGRNRMDAGPPVGLDRIEMFADGLDHPEGITITPTAASSSAVRRARSTASRTTTPSPRSPTPGGSSSGSPPTQPAGSTPIDNAHKCVADRAGDWEP